MARGPRQKSPTGFYHITQRGAGRQLLFQDDEDRNYFLNLLSLKFEQHLVTPIAWCLMSNHFHLIFEDPNDNMSDAMHALETGYAKFYKSKTGLIGPLFQNRFGSFAIESNEQLLQAIRYVHDNPLKAGLGSLLSYRWSSFHEYMGTPDIISVEPVLSLLGGVEGFYAFSTSGKPNSYCFRYGNKIADQDCAEVAQAILNPLKLTDIKGLSREERDEALRTLRAHGFMLRQIEMLTGVGIASIHRACQE